MTFIGNTMQSARSQLVEAGIESAALDVRVLMQYALRKTQEELLLCQSDEITDSEKELFDACIHRRISHEPVAKIVEQKEFYGRIFKTTANTLDPRPDTETLIEEIINNVRNSMQKPSKILDIGTGTGCILLSLLAECPELYGVGVDLSDKALQIASDNSANLGLEERSKLIKSDCFDSVEGNFDIIVSNPPYIGEGEKKELLSDVIDFEPHLSLFAPDDGLFFYKKITEQSHEYLNSGGYLFFEVGYRQAETVEDILKKKGFSNIVKKKDLSGVYRVVSGSLKK